MREYSYSSPRRHLDGPTRTTGRCPDMALALDLDLDVRRLDLDPGHGQDDLDVVEMWDGCGPHRSRGRRGDHRLPQPPGGVKSDAKPWRRTLGYLR